MSEVIVTKNHRLAPYIAILAFFSQNISLGTIYGPFGVLMLAVEARYGVTREGSSLALPLMSAAVALSAPLTGMLLERISARVLMMIGNAMGAVGYTILALSESHTAYLLVYALLFGPAIALSGMVVPSTLVTRWFAVNRGRALGFIHMPILTGVLALAAANMLRSHTLPFIYATLAGLWILNLVIAAFVIDSPPGVVGVNQVKNRMKSEAVATGTSSFSVLSHQSFWFLTFAFAATIAGQTMWGAHMIPMVRGWGITPPQAASLILVTSLAGALGNPFMGWLTDRIGARATMALLCIDCGLLWALMLLQPIYPVLLVIAFVFGFHGGATTAVFSSAISQYFGQKAFARTFGLSKMLTLPFPLIAIPFAAAIYVRTGSYVAAVMMQAVFLVIAGLGVAAGGRQRTPRQLIIAATE